MPSIEYSIIIPTYNSRNTIIPLLDSLSRQEGSDYEVIIVDDNSTDGTPELVSGYPCRVFALDKNRGAAYARNYGAGQAVGRTLIFFDSDVILHDDVMRHFRERLAQGGVDVLIGMYSGEPANRGFIPEYKAIQEEAWYARIPADKATPFTPYVGAINKGLFLGLGGFDVKYKDADVEDYEFTIKLMKKVPNIYLDKAIKVKHHFPGLNKLVRSYFRRCFLWTEVFLEKKVFETNGTTGRQGLLNIAYALSVLLFLVSIAFRPLAYAGLVMLLTALYLDRDFLSLLLGRKGILFTVCSVILNIALSFIVVSAAATGFIYYGIRALVNRRRHNA